MSGLSRRDLLRGRFFGRSTADETPTEVDEAAAPIDEAPVAEIAEAATPERALPLPPWEQTDRPAHRPSPVAQVAPWELGEAETGADGVAINARARALGGPRRAPARKMVFSIQTNLCLAWRNTPCSICRERCPAPNAITVSEGKPDIDADLCTACGDCIAVCPAPIMAIRMTPPRREPTT